MPHLWEMNTYWFYKNKNENADTTFPYKSWKEFLECKPYKIWKPYILSSWCWKMFYVNEYESKKRNLRDKSEIECDHLSGYTFSHDKPSLFTGTTEDKAGEMLQIVFLSPERYTGVHRVEIKIQREEEPFVKDWLKRHMPTFWKLESE
jgi:hypothetical protein